MTITLNGTTGITTPDVNSDGLTVDSTTLVVDEANDRVGIGTSSPGARAHIVSAAGSPQVKWSDGTNGTGTLDTASGLSRIYTNVGLAFGTGAESFTERARIDSSGNLLVGTTTNADYSSSLKFYSVAAYYAGAFKTTGGGVYSPLAAWNTASSGTINLISFLVGSGTGVGSITSNGSTTSYNTSSDYRLKENVVGVTGAAARVQQLNPVRFNFIVDPNTTVDGFLAHEVQDVVPEAITGTKDAVDAEGNPVYQGIDQSKLVPLLTAALQEALTKIDSLETRIAALEGNNV